MVTLKDGERLDDLEIQNLKIIQNDKWFRFGIDSVILSDFAKNIKKDAKVLDLGTGTGIISVLLCAKTNLKKIVGVEVQKDVYDMVERTIQLNNLQNKFQVINENIKNLNKILKKNTFDVVVTNPPYKKSGTGITNIQKQKLISRHEIMAELEDFIKISFDLLKDKGELYMVHRPERLVDILSLMRHYKVEPKKLKFVFSNKNQKPKLVLIKAVKNAKDFLDVESNLYIYNEDGEYTEELLKIYNKI